jgi:redox-sensitive bicupin YhaK (pirin superfamily)
MQIWIQPNAKGLEPRYADQPIISEAENKWKLILSPDGRDGSMAIRQDVELRTVQLAAATSIHYKTERKDRGFWLFVLDGQISVDDNELSKGDSLALSGLESLEITNAANESAKVMLFDLPL